jgi:hypothetical protein
LTEQPTISRESWDSFCREAEPLMRLHHEEIGENGVTFKLDHLRIREIERAGNVRFWIARGSEGLLGYIVWYLGWHLFSEGLRVAQMGPWYVSKEGRHTSAAIRLWATSKRDLRANGINLLLPHHQFASGFALDTMFKRQGGTPYEMTYLIWLNEPKGLER